MCRPHVPCGFSFFYNINYLFFFFEKKRRKRQRRRRKRYRYNNSYSIYVGEEEKSEGGPIVRSSYQKEKPESQKAGKQSGNINRDGIADDTKLLHHHSILVVLHLYHIFLYHTNTIELYIPGTVAITL